jgi:2-oxoglutarate dehydrogenase E2 component (dihydrolipoamide succinyltransferase)
MTSLRKRIADNLVQSQRNAAHLTTFNEIDMDRFMTIRKTHGEAFEKRHGVKLGFMSIFVKACCRALADYPGVNAMIDGDDLVFNHFANVGVAVSTERGLIVPVIHDAADKTFADIEKEIKTLAEKARAKALSVDNLTGGTFTITNGGIFGSLLSTPIPTPPQTAILGMHTIQKRAVVVNDAIVIRPMMYVALTYDHRVIDGREAVGFLVRVKQVVEEPDSLLFDL